MNSTELVRFPTRTKPSPERPRKKSPLFAPELIGPVRNAILRARHSLISLQQHDGVWLDSQPGDVALLSQLVLLAAYSGEEHSERTQQCAATIEQLQLATGGWSAMPGGAVDVSTSVQAYFALKVAGQDPTDDCLRLARNTIRNLGGADAADDETRYLLAMFGQIGYDRCRPLPPCPSRTRQSALELPMSIICSYGPVQPVAAERGVRELFIEKPCEWPTTCGTEPKQKLRQRIHRSFGKIVCVAARQNTTAAQRRALAQCRAELLANVAPSQVSQLGLRELIWHMLALQAAGYPFETVEQVACAGAVDELVRVEHESEFVHADARNTSRAATAIAVRALVESGTSPQHPAASDGLEFIRQLAADPAVTDVSSALAWANSVRCLRAIDSVVDPALPPDIDIRWGWQYSVAGDESSSDDARDQRARAIASCEFRLWEAQNVDGGWASTVAGGTSQPLSDPIATGEAIASLAENGNEQLKGGCEHGGRFLVAGQRGDGSWAMADGSQPVRSTSAAIRGLLATGHAADSECIAAAVSWLVVEQHETGAWNDDAVQTAHAVLGLVAAGHGEHAAVRRGVQFILGAQGDDGGWGERQNVSEGAASHRGVTDTCWPLLALSRYAVAASSSQSEAADHRSLRLVADGGQF